MCGKPVGDFQFVPGEPGEDRIGEFVEGDAERVKADPAQVGIDGGRNDLDDRHWRVRQLMPQRERKRVQGGLGG